MYRIYSQAANVRTWIDINLDPSDRAVRRLSVLSPDHVTRFTKAETTFISPIVRVDPNEESDEDGIGDRGDVWHSLTDLCRNSYWKRVWAQQEIINVKKLIIHCGSTSIKGEDFGEFLRQINKRVNTYAEKQAFRDWANFLTPILVVGSNRTLFYSRYSRSKPSEWESDTPLKEARRYLFSTLQAAKRSLKASDPRDYVYESYHSSMVSKKESSRSKLTIVWIRLRSAKRWYKR